MTNFDSANMKKTTALLISLCCGLASFCQQTYFIYLQTEGSQPFFLKMNEQVFSSNSSGYLIVSKLKDSTYQFSIGFPQNRWPEQAFTVSVRGRDQGFLLKNEEEGWSLQNLQTGVRIDGQIPTKNRSFKTEPKEVSRFTEVLSKAANDPSLKERIVPIEQPVVKEGEKGVAATPVQIETEPATKDSAVHVSASERQLEENKIEEKPAMQSVDSSVQSTAIQSFIQQKDTLIRREEAKAAAPVLVDTVVASAPPVVGSIPANSELVRAEEKEVITDTAGRDKANTMLDSVQALASKGDMKEKEIVEEQLVEQKETVKADHMPVYKPSNVKRRSESSTTEGFGITYIDEYPDGQKDTIRILIPNPKPVVVRDVPPPQEEAKFLPMDSDAKDLTPVKKETSKNNCTSMASETDYLKLRKKMVATDTDDAMLVAAKKVFKTKCFTTAQIRNLGTLFLNDAGRYNFFDAAYLSVSDPENFSSLESELKDEYYVNRFRAMIR